MSTLANYRLSERQRRILRPMTRIVCTEEVEQLGLTEQVLDHVELMMRSIPSFARLGLGLGILAFELLALLWPASRLTRFTKLSPERQEAYFEAWWHGPSPLLRQLLKGIKGLLALGYWDNPEVRKRMEYHPEQWIAQVATLRLQRYAQDIAAHDALVVAPAPLRPAVQPTPIAEPAERVAAPRKEAANER